MWDRCGSRQAGFTQVTVGTTEVFHCARRERVLLRDILRFGTATIFSSDLLPTGRPSPVRGCADQRLPVLVSVLTAEIKPRQLFPSRINLRFVPVVRVVVQIETAFLAQAEAVGITQGRERQLQHHSVTQGLLEVDGVVNDDAFVLIHLVSGVEVELLQPKGLLILYRTQASGALAAHLRASRSRDQHSLDDCLEFEVEIDSGALWHRDHVVAEIDRRRDINLNFLHRSWPPPQLQNVENVR